MDSVLDCHLEAAQKCCLLLIALQHFVQMLAVALLSMSASRTQPILLGILQDTCFLEHVVHTPEACLSLHILDCPWCWILPTPRADPLTRACKQASFIKLLMAEQWRHISCVGDGWNWTHTVQVRMWLDTTFAFNHLAKGAVCDIIHDINMNINNIGYDIIELWYHIILIS